MPPLEEADHVHDVVLWECTGLNDYSDYKINGPRQIKARWERTKKESLDPKGTVVQIDVVAFINEAIPIGSIMWKGLLANYPPSSTPELFQVISYTDTDDLKGRYTQRDCNLMRYRSSLPDDIGTGS